MLTTCELWLEDQDAGRRRMAPLSFASLAEVLPAAQRMLEELRLKSVEVRWHGKPLFTLRGN